jgi:signal transduction histidine kinase
MNVRRLWPQKIRARLTLGYAALFFAASAALLGITYGLVASSLPTQPPPSWAISSQEKHLLEQACGDPGTAFQSNPPTPGEKPLPGCKQAEGAYYAGTAAGMQALRENTLSNLLGFWLLGLGIMTIASGGLGWYMSGRVLRPVRVITETAKRASEQHLGERLALTGARDELKELGDTFDDMLERLDTAFASQRRFVANASHELRTPLTVMRTAIDVTLAKPSPTARQLTDMAVRVRRSIDQAESMIEALLTLAVSDQGKLSTEFTDLATWAEDAIDAAAPEIERLSLMVEAKLDPAETVGDPHLLERMINNLVNNAVRHNEPGGWIRLRTGHSHTAVYLDVSNSGPFVPDDKVPELFEPFRRMSARTGSRDGVGLGLSITRSVATAHDATVTVRSQPRGGLDVSVVIPHYRDVEGHIMVTPGAVVPRAPLIKRGPLAKMTGEVGWYSPSATSRRKTGAC